MFSIGKSEPFSPSNFGLVRHSIVWLGGPCGETPRGLPANHPLCRLLFRVLEQEEFFGTWLMCRESSLVRDLEKKTLLAKLGKSRWSVDPEQGEMIRAHKSVNADSPWPFDSDVALPWPQSEILVIGCHVDYKKIDCRNENAWRSQRSVRGDALVLHSDLTRLLSAERGSAISIGRTQTENMPGLSILGPEGCFNPESLVERHEIAGVHSGEDGARAWSYGRVN